MFKRKPPAKLDKCKAKLAEEKNEIDMTLLQKTHEERSSSIDAIETVQVIAALLAGTGIAFLDDVNKDDTSFLSESIRFFCLIFVGLNLYGLVVLSSMLFYLRQCLAKDTSMFEPFMTATKDVRYWALKGVLYSMVSCVAVVGLRQLQHASKSPVSKIGGTCFIVLAFHCLIVMWKTRQAFAKLRKKSKARQKLKAAGNAVRVTLMNKMGTPHNKETVDNLSLDVPAITPSPSKKLSPSRSSSFGHNNDDLEHAKHE